jgi:hypothetical protein
VRKQRECRVADQTDPPERHARTSMSKTACTNGSGVDRTIAAAGGGKQVSAVFRSSCT